MTDDNECVIVNIGEGQFMFDIIFYKDKNGNSEIVNYLDELKEKSKTDKNARINREKILAYMAALAEYGTRVGKPIVKHIEGDLWELRPLSNRIFFFYWKDNKFVMVHHYVKKSQKAPEKELDQARRNMKDYLERNGE